MGKIKAVHIVTRLDFGGAQFNTMYTASHLNPRLFDITLLAGPGGTMEKLPNGIKAEIVPELRRSINPYYDLKALFALARRLKEIKPDIIHTHSSKAGILGRLAAKMAGVPFIIHTFHGFGFHPYQNPAVRNLYVMLEKYCASFSSALIFVSKSNMEYASSLGIGKKEQYALIRSGIKLSAYPAKADKEKILKSLGIEGNPLIVFSIGNSKPQKNPGDFIKAAAELLRNRNNLVFVFAGGGDELPKFKAMAKDLGIEKKCLLPGWRADSAEILAVSDIYAMTSLWEGLPRSLVEAFASGLPAVCYRADGVTDILKDGVNGYSMEKKDISSYIEKLGKLIDDVSLRKKLAEGAKDTELSEFDIDFMVLQQEKLYLGLKDGSKPCMIDLHKA